MIDIYWTITALTALMVAYPALILHDVHRHQAAPQPPPADRGAMTTTGVPYVATPVPERV